MRALASVLLVVLFGSSAAVGAPRRPDHSVTWWANSEVSVTYGEVEDDSRFDLRCSAAGGMAANFPDGPMADVQGPLQVTVEGLGVKKTAPFTLPEGEGGTLSVPVAPDSLVLATLLTGQPLTFRRGSTAYVVPAARGTDAVRGLAVRCFTGQAVKASTPTPEDGDLMKRNDQAGARCAYGPSAATATRAACAEQNATISRLAKSGWCFGRDEDFGKVYRWHRCGPD